MSSRRALTAVLLLLPALLGAARDENRLTVKVHLFDDNRDVFVGSPQIRAHWKLDERTELRGLVEVDAVSSASPACGACHGGMMSAPRVEFQAGVSRDVGWAKAGLGYYISREQDYSADALSVSLERDFFQKNSTLLARYALSFDRAHPHGWGDLFGQGKEEGIGLDPEIVLAPSESPLTSTGHKTVHNASLSWTQVLSPGTLGRLTYEAFWSAGYHDNPYWTIPIGSLDYLESHPDARRRQAASVRVRQSVSTDMALEAGYRRYGDSWGVHSDTYLVSVSRYLSERKFRLDFDYRFYAQDAADFHRDRYVVPAENLSADFRLDDFDSHLTAVRLQINSSSTGSWRSPDSYDIKIERFTTSEGFESWVLELGVVSGF